MHEQEEQRRYVTRIGLMNHPQDRAEAVERWRRGELVAFATETVYGLGGNGFDAEACRSIYTVKGRPSDNPLILHVADAQQLEMIVHIRPAMRERVARLVQCCWPGPLTLIFPRRSTVPDVVTGGGDTVAVRIPVHKEARLLLREVGLPIAAPSANRSGRPSPTCAQDVWEDLQGRIPLILDGGACEIGVESTVLDLTDEPTILRPGWYTQEKLEQILECAVSFDPALGGKGVPRSPGQKYRHYAPSVPVRVFVGEDAWMREQLKEQVRYFHQHGQKVGIIAFENLKVAEADAFISLDAKEDLQRMGQKLFHALRTFDGQVDQILVSGVEERGYGLSLMNRLKKAASGDVVYAEPKE